MSRTSIYVIGNEQGPLKIGYSADPLKRLSNIQTGQSVKMQLFYSEETDTSIAKIIEKIIHSNLAHKRVRGEWFSVTLSEAIDEVKFAFIRYEGETNLPLLYKYKLI